MQNATHTKNLPKETPSLPKNLPKDMEKISEQIISDQQIIQQFSPKILRTVLTNQVQQIFAGPKDQKIIQKPKDQKIIDITESKITKPQNIYLDNRVQLFSPDELKNAIYRYNQNLTKINDITKKNGNVDLLDQLTDILDISAHTAPPT